MTDALPTDDPAHVPSWARWGITSLRPSHVRVPIRRLFPDDTTPQAAIGLYWILQFLKERTGDDFGPFSLVDVEAFICRTVHRWIIACRESITVQPPLLPGVAGDRPAEIAMRLVDTAITTVLLEDGVFEKARNDIHPDRYKPGPRLFQLIDEQDLTAPDNTGTTVMEAMTHSAKHPYTS